MSSKQLDLTLFAGRYSDSNNANNDFEAVKSLRTRKIDLLEIFDAVLFRRNNRDIKVIDKIEKPTREGVYAGLGIGMDTALIAACFPAVAFSAGLLAASMAAGSALGGLLAHKYEGGIKNKNIQELGLLVNVDEFGLLAIVDSALADEIKEVITLADEMMVREYKVDKKEIADRATAIIEDAVGEKAEKE